MKDFEHEEKAELDSMKQQAESWSDVVDCLMKHNPNLWQLNEQPHIPGKGKVIRHNKTGCQLVLEEIRRLQALDK